MTAVQNSPSSYQRDNNKTLKHATIAAGVGGAIGAAFYHLGQSGYMNNKELRDAYLSQVDLENKLAKKPGLFNMNKDMYEAIKNKKINSALTAKGAGYFAGLFLVLYGIVHGIKSLMTRRGEEEYE